MPNSLARASACAPNAVATPNRPITIATTSSMYVTAKLRSKIASETARMPDTSFTSSACAPSSARIAAITSAARASGASHSAASVTRASPVIATYASCDIAIAPPCRA